MKKAFMIVLVFLFLPFAANAQKERKYIREGVKEYQEGKYNEAEISFRNALEKDSSSLPANYDVANSLYKQEKYDEAGKLYSDLSGEMTSDKERADAWHNLGNSFLQKKDYEKSIEAYKNSLRIRPADDQTRYNLAYAQAMLKRQQEQEKQQQQKDKQENKDKEQENKNKQDQQEKQKQEDEQKQQEQKQQDQKQEDQKKQEQTQAVKQGISKEEMERMLQAIQQQEKKVLNKIEKEKAKPAKVTTEKDW